MDWCRKIGEQISSQPFEASASLAPPGLGPPGGPRLADSRQRHSLGGAGAWRAGEAAGACRMAIGEQKGQIAQG